MRLRLLPEVVADHAGFFKVAGDMNAYLYTSSRAMHSDILNLLSGQVWSAAGGLGFLGLGAGIFQGFRPAVRPGAEGGLGFLGLRAWI